MRYPPVNTTEKSRDSDPAKRGAILDCGGGRCNCQKPAQLSAVLFAYTAGTMQYQAMDSGQCMRVLVIGGTGFIGYHVVKALQAQGDEVAVLCRNAQAASELF